jgi:hypothetical protein
LPRLVQFHKNYKLIHFISYFATNNINLLDNKMTQR